jgi:hypothetical protein
MGARTIRRRLAEVCFGLGLVGCAPGTVLTVVEDADREQVTVDVRLAGHEAFRVEHSRRFAIPHLFPLLSPTGRPLLVQQTDPYPHHRSLWIADRIQLEDGPVTDFYHAHTNLKDPGRPELGYHSLIRHESFSEFDVDEQRAGFTARLTWIIGGQGPALDDTREFRVRDLGHGEYLIDLSWRLTANYGKVTFKSDWVHYAWPYLRMDPSFSGESGGRIEDDRGRTGQNATNGETARWIDYSNRVEGVTEGVAVFLPRDGYDRKWLTREYGTFGPRRKDALSGTGFSLAVGESLAGRVGILVHSGDAKTGRVAERYAEYVGAR